MSDAFLIGFDLGTQKNGWCAGAGDKLPIAGAFRLDKINSDQIGDMGVQFTDRMMAVHRQFPQATHWLYERPLLVPTDDRFTLERLYGVACLLATLGRKLGKVVKPIDNGAAKAEFAGRNASKDDMVAMAEKLGIALPLTKVDGREDAADAIGVWKVGVKLYAKAHLQRLDTAIYRRRGSLV